MARTGRVEVPAVRGERHQGLLVRRSQVGHLFGHLAAWWWPGRGHDGKRHVGKRRGLLDLATRAIDPAGLVERAIPAQRIADTEDGVQGTDQPGWRAAIARSSGCVASTSTTPHTSSGSRRANSCTYSPPRE